MNTKRTFLLNSGGLDSTVLLYERIQQGYEVHCGLFDYKQRHVQELLFAKTHCHRLHVLFTTIELPQLHGSELTDGNGGVVVPFRNPLFLAHAVNAAASLGISQIDIAVNAGDQADFPDCRQGLLDAFNTVITLAGYQITICAPYIMRSKAWIAALGQELGVRFNETWSCYRGGAQPCGVCPACIKRQEALATL